MVSTLRFHREIAGSTPAVEVSFFLAFYFVPSHRWRYSDAGRPSCGRAQCAMRCGRGGGCVRWLSRDSASFRGFVAYVQHSAFSASELTVSKPCYTEAHPARTVAEAPLTALLDSFSPPVRNSIFSDRHETRFVSLRGHSLGTQADQRPLTVFFLSFLSVFLSVCLFLSVSG